MLISIRLYEAEGELSLLLVLIHLGEAVALIVEFTAEDLPEAGLHGGELGAGMVGKLDTECTHRRWWGLRGFS